MKISKYKQLAGCLCLVCGNRRKKGNSSTITQARRDHRHYQSLITQGSYVEERKIYAVDYTSFSVRTEHTLSSRGVRKKRQIL